MLKVGLNHDRLADVTQPGKLSEDQLVNEFLGSAHHRPAVPQTYNMTALLEELQASSAQQQATPPMPLHSTAAAHQNDTKVKEWVEEFATPPVQTVPPPATADWAAEFQREQRQEPVSAETERWVKEFAGSEEEKWVQEFEGQSQQQQQRSLASVAKEMTETVTDPEIRATEFMDFIKKVSTGEAVFEGDQREDGWTEEFLEGESRSKGFWDNMEKEWQDMAQQEAHPWLTEFESPKPPEYRFEEDNPLRDVQKPLEAGLGKLAEGDLPSAVLLFEAEVQARPDSVRGWQLLGSTQADNEQDQAAIAALSKCLELDAGNLLAHMSLAVCFTNESKQTKALDALRGWIRHHPKYASLLPGEAAKATPPFESSFMTREEHGQVRDLFLAAAQMSPERVDCDVQVGLGVLFNLSSEYDKAVDCFTAGLQVKPDDAMLWNKLGATLANNNKSEEAVEAYRKALQILPGFTRSRYNLGVSCINLGAYKEAVEHFLTALNLQREAKGPTAGVQRQPSQMSDSIWSTLRLAISMSGRPHLLPAIQARNLDLLMREFAVE